MQRKRYAIASSAAAVEVASTAMKPGAYVGASLGLNNIGPTKLPSRDVSVTAKSLGGVTDQDSIL
jgi:hypothetical protein